jgi:hypothetical protein
MSARLLQAGNDASGSYHVEKVFFFYFTWKVYRIKRCLEPRKQQSPSFVFAAPVIILLLSFFLIILSIVGAGKVGLPVPRVAFASSAEMEAAV